MHRWFVTALVYGLLTLFTLQSVYWRYEINVEDDILVDDILVEERLEQVLEQEEQALVEETLESSKPTLLLHIGPAKTATTSLQTYWTEISLPDNWSYQGRFYHPHLNRHGTGWMLNRTLSPLAIALRQITFNHTAAIPHLRYELSQIVQNTLVSDESWGRWNREDYRVLESFTDMLDIQVLLVHRPFHEWIVSKKYQMDRLDDFKPRATRWKHPNAGPKAWTDDNDFAWRSRKSTADWIDQIPFPTRLVRFGDNICQRVTCEGILQSPKTDCDTTLPLPTHQLNVRMERDMPQWDSLVLLAAHRGFIDKRRFTRVEVRNTLSANYTLPPSNHCLNATVLEELRQYAWQQELRVYSDAKLEDIVLDPSKYCWVDTHRIVEEWKEQGVWDAWK